MGNSAQNAAEARKLTIFFEREFNKKQKEISDYLIKEIRRGKDIDKTILRAFQIFKFDETMLQLFEQRAVEAALIGLGLLPTKIDLIPAGIESKLISTAWTGDGLKLSKRIAKTSKNLQKSLMLDIKQKLREEDKFLKLNKSIKKYIGDGKIKSDAINSQVDRILKQTDSVKLRKELNAFKKTVSKMSEMGYPSSRLGRSYSRFIKAVESGNKERIDKAIANIVKAKTNYVSQRIALTEMNRAYHDGFFAKNQDDKDVAAYKWTLSSAHKVLDICDVHASSDMYGLGPGIYPKDNYPAYPAHPHCRCYPTPIYPINIDDKKPKNQVNDGGYNFINKQSTHNKQMLLGKKGLEEFEKTGEWRSNLRSYQGHSKPNPRINKKDVDNLLK